MKNDYMKYLEYIREVSLPSLHKQDALAKIADALEQQVSDLNFVKEIGYDLTEKEERNVGRALTCLQCVTRRIQIISDCMKWKLDKNDTTLFDRELMITNDENKVKFKEWLKDKNKSVCLGTTDEL